jgi:uncharacterized protein YjiS (DUF1127 family)
MNPQTTSAYAAVSDASAVRRLAVGRVKRSYTVPGRTSDACNESMFGNGAIGQSTAAPASALDRRAQRYLNLLDRLAALRTSVGQAIARRVAAWRRSRDARETVRALQGLDAHALRDLGLHESELHSIARELSGAVEPTRAHALMRLRFLSI